MTKRRKFSAEFKAKVALEALSGELTLAELSAKYEVHPTMVASWKRQAKEKMVAGFAG
ncbi:MAG: transposase, partial [Okeania sp. SIO3B3]|nr:transposase [Okeania sp. SIO3B3]